jgi:RNA polymerase sigma-70 factor, ECF subfamily
MDDLQIEQVLQRLGEDRDNEEAWTALYTHFRPFVYALAYRRTAGSRDLAKDAAQEVFFRLVKYCPFRKLTDADAFRVYLAVVTRNVMAILRRRERVFEVQAGIPDAEWSELVLTPYGETVELRQLLLRALREFSEREQKLLALRLEGYSQQEIADRLGISPGNVAVRLHRIRGRLRANPLLADLI